MTLDSGVVANECDGPFHRFAGGEPSGRLVLLKGFDAEGFVFFTHYQSDKARDLEPIPRRTDFRWIELERQVRIEGTSRNTPRAAVEAYFQTRPGASRLGGVGFHQSRVIADREILTARLAEAEARFPQTFRPLPNGAGIAWRRKGSNFGRAERTGFMTPPLSAGGRALDHRALAPENLEPVNISLGSIPRRLRRAVCRW